MKKDETGLDINAFQWGAQCYKYPAMNKIRQRTWWDMHCKKIIREMAEKSQSSCHILYLEQVSYRIHFRITEQLMGHFDSKNSNDKFFGPL